MPLLTAKTQLYGDWGNVPAGKEFYCEDEEQARELIRTGKVFSPAPPRVQYETKVIVPEAPEVSARLPFRDVPVSHQESTSVVAESDPVLPSADVPKSGTPDLGGRRGRARPGSSR
jgi:hypothetical protein